MPHRWIADRMRSFDSSGIRKVFEMAGKIRDPINLSIGQPHFDVPGDVRAAAIAAIESGKNAYSPTPGIPALRDKLQAGIDAEFGDTNRKVFVTSGTSGGLYLVVMTLVNPGDEVIIFDPYFVVYPALVNMLGGRAVMVDTYPDFRIDLDKVRAAISPRTKMILFNSPANPTGAVASEAEVRGLAELAAEHGVALVSDEIYREFCFDDPFVSPARFNRDTLVIDGFSKSHAMTGWRVGFAHGPADVIEEMLKLQQYTFVCAPQPAQWAALTAIDTSMAGEVADYRQKRDHMVAGLAGAFEFTKPGGAFYLFPRAPWGTGSQFCAKAIEQGVLIIPGKIFSQIDSHFRISYAAADEVLERGIEALEKLARQGA